MRLLRARERRERLTGLIRNLTRVRAPQVGAARAGAALLSRGDAWARARALPWYDDYVSGLAGDGVTRDDGAAALLVAAHAGDAVLVEVLLREGFYLEARGGPSGEIALHVAAAHGHSDVVELLFEEGADYRALDAHGSTPAEAARDGEGHSAVSVLIDEYTAEPWKQGALRFDRAVSCLMAHLDL